MASTKFVTPITHLPAKRLRNMCRYENISNDLSLTQAELVALLDA